MREADHKGLLKVRPVSYPLTGQPLNDGVHSEGNERRQVSVKYYLTEWEEEAAVGSRGEVGVTDVQPREEVNQVLTDSR